MIPPRYFAHIAFVSLAAQAFGQAPDERAPAATLAHPKKAGIGIWEDKATKLPPRLMNELGIAWYYNWTPSPSDGYRGNVEFVPMIWGSTHAIDALLEAAGAAPGDAILGFNEPDHGWQTAMSVDNAIALWPRLEATARKSGKRLGSPASSGDPLKGWLAEFMEKADVAGLKIDFICIHTYAFDDVAKLEAHLDAVHRKYGRPIWITEFARANWKDHSIFSYDEQADWLGRVSVLCDRLEYVERTAWFGMWTNSAWRWNVGTFTNESTLTPVARTFRRLTGHEK